MMKRRGITRRKSLKTIGGLLQFRQGLERGLENDTGRKNVGEGRKNKGRNCEGIR